MKTTFLTIIIIFLTAFEPSDKFYSKWKLEKIITENDTLIPKRDFFLEISSERLTYNTDANECFTRDFKTTQDSIIYNMVFCTRSCCDGRDDPIGKIIKYQGTYQINETYLIIRNEIGTIYMIRK